VSAPGSGGILSASGAAAGHQAGLSRPVRIAVCGEGLPGPLDPDAYAVGRLIAKAGAILLTGGLGGAMEAASRGAADAGGLVIGILPTYDALSANPHVTIPLCTGMGHARNMVLVASAQAVIAIGGKWGTLSEVALARKVGRPVVLLHAWDVPALLLEPDPLLVIASSPEDAVAQALAFAAGR